MKTKINLALTPVHFSENFIQISQSISNLSDEYLLSYRSLPHVTLRQFYIEQSEINDVWQKIKNINNHKIIKLKFLEISYITFDNEIFWVSLLPDNNELLTKLHRRTSLLLDLNINNKYDPHLTLINSRNTNFQNEAQITLRDFESIEDEFALSLGYCDDIGQLTKTIFTTTS